MNYRRLAMLTAMALAASLITATSVNASAVSDSSCGGDCGQWRQMSDELARPLHPATPFRECFEDAAERYDVPQRLLAAIAAGESDFNPLAVSSAGAIGVMQIMWPITARHLGVGNKSRLFDACQNIHAGARYFKELLKRYEGNTHRALAAYNMGPERVKHGIVPTHGARYSDYIYRRYLSLDALKTNPLTLFEVANAHTANRWVRVLSGQFPSTYFSFQRQPSGQITVLAQSGSGDTYELVRHINSMFYPQS
mgnify:CR=1 FL=1